MKQLLLLITTFLLFSTHSAIAQEQTIKRVLFVGNSYTYFWNLPSLVDAMAESRNIELETRQSTSGGVNLGMHWRGERNLETLSKIEKGKFDAVVLQDHSLRAIEHPDSLQYFGSLLSEKIKAAGARPCFYLTWARQHKPQMQDDISREYNQVAAKNKTLIAPVGEAWDLALKQRPSLQLHDQDGSHPSTLGAYLNACVFFAVLTNQSPVGLPNRLTTIDANGEKLYLMIVGKEDATFCQQIAQQVVSNITVDQK